MGKVDAAQTWSLNYKLLSSVIVDAAVDIAKVGLETKEFFVLAEIDQCPYPAELSVRLSMPKPTITVYLKSLEAAGFVRREIDAQDLRRHRLILTPAGRKAMNRASKILSDAYGERLARLNSTERGQLQKLLEKLS
jgi:DNA-binding MarR family transcriptional regulator